jgi:hypothetical protein
MIAQEGLFLAKIEKKIMMHEIIRVSNSNPQMHIKKNTLLSKTKIKVQSIKY